MDQTDHEKSNALGSPNSGGLQHRTAVKFFDGEEVHGTVFEFNPKRPTFFLHTDDLADAAASREINLLAVKMVSFMRSGQGSETAVRFSSMEKLITVRFIDRDAIRGVTQGYGGTRQGIFVVPVARQGIERIYIPMTAIREVVSIKRFGEIMTQEGVAGAEIVEQAIARQEQLRREPIGQILIRHQAISPQQLEEGLRLQQQRDGKRLGEILAERRIVNQPQLEMALVSQQHQRNKRLGEICAEMGCTTDQVGRALAIQYNLPYVELSDRKVDPSLRRIVPEEVAKRHKIMPIDFDNNMLNIAVSDPTEHSAKDELQAKTGFTVLESVATPQDITQAIHQFYQ